MNTSKYLDNLSNLLLEMKTKVQMDNFLLGVLTPGEIEEINRRLSIVKLLKKGMSQHKIAKKLNVGIATVTRGSKELQKGRFKYV